MSAALAPWLQRALTQALQQRRSHALLLGGPAGLGQFELAQAVLAAWLCERASAGEAACGQCPSCHLLSQHSHPDAHWLMPAALRVRLGWAEERDVVRSGAKPSQEIRVDEVRAMLPFAQTTPARGRGKAVAMFPAERLNTIAGNALLKTLEEPGPSLRFVLASEAADTLLPTVRSRCQLVALSAPPQPEALQWLHGQGIEGGELLLALAGGQPMLARDWHAQGWRAETLATLPRALAAGDLTRWAESRPAALVDLLQRLLLDLLHAAHGQPARHFVGVALPKVRHAEPLLQWGEELQRAKARAEHPLGWPLWLDALGARGQAALRRACSLN